LAGHRLFLASWHGHLDIVLELIARDANAIAASRSGLTPLMAASYYGHVEVVRALLAAGADKHRANCYGDTAASLAETDALQGSRAILALLAAAP
jgi:ankyrin repeat protein